MTITKEIQKKVKEFKGKPKYLLLDDQSFFTLKEEHFGSVDSALENDLFEFMGMKVFSNHLDKNYVNVVG